MLYLTLMAALVAAQPSCSLLNAQYTLSGASSMTAYFRQRQPTSGRPFPVYLVIKSNLIGKTYYFIPIETGSGAGIKTHLVLSKGPSSGIDNVDNLENIFAPMDYYLVANSKYSFIQSFAPTAGVEAPVHILVPGLQELMWYGDLNKRQDIPLAFFDLSDCHA